jgi:hypothetical protein
MKNTIIVPVTLAALCALCTSGCETIQEEPAFGSAYQQQKLSQQLNPGPKDDKPIEGMDGRLARNVYKGYIDPAETAKQKKTASDFMLLMEAEK